MSNTIDKYIIITISILSNPYPCHSYMLITENYSSKFSITSFWAPALKSPAENSIPKKYLYTSLNVIKCLNLQDIILRVRSNIQSSIQNSVAYHFVCCFCLFFHHNHHLEIK